MAAGGAAIGGAIGTGIGLATGGPPAAVATGVAGAAIGGMVGTAIGVGYEVNEHREAIAAGAQAVGEGASGVYGSAVSDGQQSIRASK